MSKQTKRFIAVGGENLIDTMHSTDAGGAAYVTHKLGGSPYNVAFSLARQDQNTQYITPISNDEYGQQLAANLEAEDVVLGGQRRDEPTTEAVVTLKDGIPHYVFHRTGTAERCVTTQNLSAALTKDTIHFHAGSLAFAGVDDGPTWEAVFVEAGARGLTTSFDPNIRSALLENVVSYRARVMRLLRMATIVKLSDEDLEWIYPDLSQKEAIETLLSMTNAKLVALTKGVNGAEGWTPSLHCSVENPLLEAFVDTVGAGDTFMATLIAGLSDEGLLSDAALANISQADLHKLLLRGVQAACLNCGKEGCNPPTVTEINDALAKTSG